MSIDMTNYSYSETGYPQLSEVLNRYGAKKVVLIGGKRALAAAENKIRTALKDIDVEITGAFVYGTECTRNNIAKLAEKKEVQNADVLFAIGGGKAIDTVKTLSITMQKIVFSFPTITSNCSAATSISVVYNEDGSLEKYDYPKAPIHMFIDGEIIANAPEQYFWAGIGDGMSKEPEVEFASRGKDLPHSTRMGVSLAKSCAAPFFEYGEQALNDCKNNISSNAIKEIALNILISTGYVSNLTNSPDAYYNSSLAHAFYNGATKIDDLTEKHLHGEVVSFGTLVLHAYDGNMDGLEKYAKFNHLLGLPVTLEEMDLTENDLPKIADAATNTNEWKSAPYPFTKEKFIDAIKMADTYGQKLK